VFVLSEQGRKVRKNEVAEIYRKHFTLPENGLEGLEETSFYVDYADVRFIFLNTNMMLKEQAAWLDGLLEDNPRKWTILTFHHPFYSGGRGRDSDEPRTTLLGVVDKYHVDLVLTGHDHTYSRSYKLVNNSVVPWNAVGTVYALSVSGPKQYEPTHPYSSLMENTGGFMQLFQVITIEDNMLKYAAYTVNGELFDEFTLEKRKVQAEDNDPEKNRK
jgi:3',5'-cyclic AMP phosphodiesterase CpdA